MSEASGTAARSSLADKTKQTFKTPQKPSLFCFIFEERREKVVWWGELFNYDRVDCRRPGGWGRGGLLVLAAPVGDQIFKFTPLRAAEAPRRLLALLRRAVWRQRVVGAPRQPELFFCAAEVPRSVPSAHLPGLVEVEVVGIGASCTLHHSHALSKVPTEYSDLHIFCATVDVHDVHPVLVFLLSRGS